MDKIDRIRASLIKYLIPCFVICALGIIGIELLILYLQTWYGSKYIGIGSSFFYDDALLETNPAKLTERMRNYKLISYSKVLLMPLWSVVCLWFTVRRFYRREIKKPVYVLTRASERILSDDLDFSIECDSQNELGSLCVSFEDMRKNLYDSNYRLWKSLEDRKRLNSAFSHDLRTPITVLKGYMELIEQYDGNLPPEKQDEILSKMSGQVSRLENYTEKMSSIHKLEDIIPDVKETTYGKLCGQIEENGRLLCGADRFRFTAEGNADTLIYTDMELVMQVFMNLVSNADRYAASCVDCSVILEDESFSVTVSDDGCGFSEEAIRKAWQPFYRADDENDKEHFGLGLYICWLLSRKAGGGLTVGNVENGGGKATAVFSKNISENR